MITLRTYRQCVETALKDFFPYINLHKQTVLNNLAAKTMVNDEYLSAVVLNCLLAEIEKILLRKIVNTKAQKIKFEFTDAHGVLLYKTLLALPLPPDNIYLHQVRNEWVGQLDQQIITNNIYHNNRPQKASPPPRTFADYAED